MGGIGQRDVEEQQVLMHIDALEQGLHPELAAADMLHVPAVQTVYGVHQAGDDRGVLLAELGHTDGASARGRFRREPTVHIDVQRFRLLLVGDEERIERAVARDDREVRLAGEIPDGGLDAHHVLHAVRLARDDVRAAQVDIADLRGEKDMHRLTERHADPVGRDMLAGGQDSDPGLRLGLLRPAGHPRQRSHD